MLSQSNSVNSSCFIVNHSEVEGRLDPYYYIPQFKELDFILRNIKSVKFSSIIKSITNGFDFRNYQEFGTPYIKVANIKKGEFDFSKIQYINLEASDITKNIQLKKGNLLLTRKGTFGNALALRDTYNYIISSEIFYIDLDNTMINSEYLEIVLNSSIGQKQFDRNKIGAIMGSLSQDAVKQIIIPLPSMQIQQQIVDMYNRAFNEKQERETESNRLLNSIDSYLLDELGVKLPKIDNSLQCRIFTTTFKDVTGSRLDPKLYDTTTRNLKNAIENSPISKISLKNMIAHSSAGDWGVDETEEVDDEKYQKCLVIRATEFDNKYNLNLDNSRVKYRLINRSKLSKMNIRENDLLIEKSGGSPDQPVGRIAILSQDVINGDLICYSNFIHKIRIDETKAVPMYVFSFLKTLHNIKLTEAMQSQTNGIRNLIMSTYLNQTIVFPSIEKQKEIANNIKTLRERAKRLQAEASDIIEKAKKRVEQILLDDK